MLHSTETKRAFSAALEHLPAEVAGDVWADKYKYLTDLELVRPELTRDTLTILDVGGARGAMLLMLKQLGHAGLHLVDRFDRMEREIIEDRKHPTVEIWERFGVDVKECDVAKQRLPYADATFDVISAVDLIEHFGESSRGFFAELYRVLRPGGVLLTGCPNVANLQNRIKLLLGKSVHSSLGIWHNAHHYRGHLREFTLSEVESMVTAAGFEVVRRRMGEEQLDSVIFDRAKLQRDRTPDSMTLDLKKPGDLAFYVFILVYYAIAQLLPGCRYFIRVVARKPTASAPALSA
jgi:SAM-dependent methyltransferase